MAGKLDPVKSQMLNRAQAALRVIGGDLQARAVPLTPIEEGTLRGAYTVDVERQANAVVLTVSVNTPYAERQHEGLDFQHPKGGQAKFLEQPAKEMMPRYEGILAKAMGKLT